MRSSSLTRRQFIGATVGGGIAGGLWGAGLSTLARGRHPQILILGDKAWQLVLIEDRDARLLLLSGTFDYSPIDLIDRQLGILRQHIDIVAGTHENLMLLPGNFRHRRKVSTTVQMDGATWANSSTLNVHLLEPIEVGIGSLKLSFERIPQNEWSGLADSESTWIGHLTFGDLVVSIAASLNDVAAYGRESSTLAIAPSGSLEVLRRNMPGLAVATNTQTAGDAMPSSSVGSTTVRPLLLARTFPTDLATFRFVGGQIEVPDWSQNVLF